MRILHVHTRYRQAGGEDSVVAAERALLEENGHEVVALDYENPTEAVPAARALAQAPWNRGAAALARARAREARVDLAHIHNTWFAASPSVPAALSQDGIPTVATFHNYRLVCVNAMLVRDGQVCELCVGRAPTPGVRYGCYRGSRGSSAMVALTLSVHRRRHTWERDLGVALVLTDFARSKLLPGGLPADRTLVVPNFVPDPGPRLLPAAASDEVLFVGRLAPEKGIRVLIHAWQRAGIRDLRLTVIGDGPEREAVTVEAPPGVVVEGRVPPDEVSRRMLGARALVFPSTWYEGQPMVLLEALAAGLPVLFSDLGALGETVGSGGRSFPPGDAGDLADALLGLEDAGWIDRTSSNARAEYQSRFTPQLGLEHRLGAYRRAIDWADRPT